MIGEKSDVLLLDTDDAKELARGLKEVGKYHKLPVLNIAPDKMALIVMARIAYKVYKPKVVAIIKPDRPPGNERNAVQQPPVASSAMSPSLAQEVHVSDWLDPNSNIH